MNWLDIVFLIIFAIAIYKGTKKGFIMSLSKLVALIVGIWVAVKFSDRIVAFAMYKFPSIAESTSNWSPQTIKIISFIVIFIIVALLINLLGKLIEKFADMVSLKGLNKILGAVFNLAKYILLLSLLFYILNMFNILSYFVSERTQETSLIYKHVEKVVPIIINEKEIKQDNTIHI
ncbi:MAG: CvpA family protein [Bacteroidales bacterium]|jgi:membrane protein required for colicin V production